MKKRTLSLITALALCLSLLPAGVLAAEGEGDGPPQDAVAEIRKQDGSTTYVAAEELDAALAKDSGNDGAEITLLDDVTRETTLHIQIGCTLDLGGHTVSCDDNTCIIIGGYASAVTIQGKGEVISENEHALAVGKDTTLKGGTFTSRADNFSGVYVFVEDAVLSVAGTDVRIQNTGGGYGLSVNGGAVQLSAGTYSGGAGAIICYWNGGNSPTLRELLAPEHAYFDGDTPVTDIPEEWDNSSMTLTQPEVTVKPCTHPEGASGYQQDESILERHQPLCRACGFLGPMENCQYTYTSVDDTTHKGVCVCGREKTVVHTWIPAFSEPVNDVVTVSRTCSRCGDKTDVGTLTLVNNNQTITFGQTPRPLELKADGITISQFNWSNDQVSEGISTESTYTPQTPNATTYTLNCTVRIPGKDFLMTVSDVALIHRIQFTLTVTPAPLTADMVTLPEEKIVYSGAAQEPAVTVRQGEKTLVAGTDYEVSYANNVDAGTATVTVTGKGNYQGTVEKTFTIEKAALTVPGGGADAKATGEYGTPLSELTVDGPAVTWANGTVPGSWVIQSGDAPDVGTYTYEATFEPDGGTENFTGLPLTVPVEVAVTKAKLFESQYNSLQGIRGTTVECDVGDTAQGPLSGFAGWTLRVANVTDENGILDGTPTVDGTKLVCKIKADAPVGETVMSAFVRLTASTKNYQDFTITVTVAAADKFVPFIRAVDEKTYDGRPFDFTGWYADVNGEKVPGAFSFVDADPPVNVSDSGRYTIRFTPDDANQYKEVEVTGSLTISPASAVVAADSKTVTKGSPAPAYTCTVTPSGAVLGFEPTLTCEYTPDSPAGTYPITATGPEQSEDGNYTASYVDGTLTVNNPSGGGGGGGGGGGSVDPDPDDPDPDDPDPDDPDPDDPDPDDPDPDDPDPDDPDPDDPDPDDPDHIETEIKVEEGISKVPDGLKNIPELNTPAKLAQAMLLKVAQADSAIPAKNTAVYDVALMVSTDGGKTWTPATKDNFPSGGLTVTLPYPAGTDRTYQFTVVHMFTTSDFGKTPGETEQPAVANVEGGIRFTVTGLSPISVGWREKEKPPQPDDPDPTPSRPSGGGGSSVSSYRVTLEPAVHGTVASNRTHASDGSLVTLTAAPDSGYLLDALTVTDSKGGQLKLTDKGGGKYAFTMPSRPVTVKATFAPVQAPWSSPYSDVPEDAWYAEAVRFVTEQNLMGGYTDSLFGPNDNLSRAQLAQILFNREGRPVVNYLLQYGDVPEGAWYAEAIRWAASQGIVSGYGGGLFGPDDPLTREQLAVMLWRYAGSPAPSNLRLDFSDADQAGGYALDALRWAVDQGVVSGSGGALDPVGPATRAQAAQMLKSFLEPQR